MGTVAALISYVVAQPMLEPQGLNYEVTADGVIPSILNAGTYLALVAILSLGIGALLRNSAGGIMATLGLLIVAPIVLAILSGQNELFMDISRYLPSSAGTQMVAIRPSAGGADPDGRRPCHARMGGRGACRRAGDCEATGRVTTLRW